MKKTMIVSLLLITLSSLNLSLFAQERSKLSDSELERSLRECLYKYDSQYSISKFEHKMDLDIPHCGGTIKVKKSNDYNQKIPKVILKNTKKCSYITIGTNSRFEAKPLTSHHALEGYRTDFDGSYFIKGSQVNFDKYGSNNNNVRLVVHSKSGKTCARIKINLGKVY